MGAVRIDVDEEHKQAISLLEEQLQLIKVICKVIGRDYSEDLAEDIGKAISDNLVNVKGSNEIDSKRSINKKLRKNNRSSSKVSREE